MQVGIILGQGVVLLQDEILEIQNNGGVGVLGR